MISSSHFFKKTFFTIDQKQTAQKEEQGCGPWKQDNVNPLSYSLNMTKKKRMSLNGRLQETSSSLERSFLLQRRTVLRNKKQARNKEEQISHLVKLPHINQSDINGTFQNRFISLESGMNFITRNNRSCLKKLIEKSKYETLVPHSETYRKCQLAAKHHIYELNKNRLFYNG